MADIEIRHLDDAVVAALEARAMARGVSLDEEIRSTLGAAVASHKEAFERRAAAIRAAIGNRPGKPELDSARLIRMERDSWG